MNFVMNRSGYEQSLFLFQLHYSVWIHFWPRSSTFMIFSSLCNYLTLCVSKDLTSCLTATPKTLLDTLQQFVGAPVSFWPCQWNLTKKTYSKWSYYSTDHKNYIIFLFEHFLSRLLDPQKSTFGDVILEVKLFLNEVIKK